MNASLAWLKEFVATTTPGFELGEKFRMTSSEAEGITNWKEKLAGLVIGHVLAVKPHPNADRLRVATVDIGTEKRTIVCGASNLEEGQYVIVALPGITLHPVVGEPMVMRETKIRDVQSQGMLCALEEIGIAIASPGIFVYPETLKPGASVSSTLFEDDIVIDLDITPNRPDLLSHFGLAREVAAFERRKLSEPTIAPLEHSHTHQTHLELTLSHHKDCLRYSAIALNNVQVKPSPWWLQSRLIRCGIRPINTVVDVTNYVMLELGQPLHAFDLDTLPKQKEVFGIAVRSAKPDEKIDLLDDSTRTLIAGDIVIADGNDKAIALAGIMGGKHSAISESTTRIVLESATFSGPQIRKTSRHLGLRSEASLRFEKGLDTELTVTALKRALYLLQQVAGATVDSKLVDNTVHAHQRPRIHVSFDRIHQLLGVRISAADCRTILLKLNFDLPSFTKSGFDAVPPTWRHDVQQVEDVIEELIRIWGYDRLPYTLPTGAVKAPALNQSVNDKRLIRHALSAAGFHETVHQPFSSEQALEKLNLKPKEALLLPNPLSQETSYLNPTHLLGMLADCAGINSSYTELLLFEIGKVFKAPLAEQETLTLLVRTGGQAEQAVRQLKAALVRISQVLSLPQPTYTSVKDLPYAEKGHTLTIQVGNTEVGHLSLISNEVVSAYKMKRGKELVAAIINLELLLGSSRLQTFYSASPVYPVSVRDLTITVSIATSLDSLTTKAAQVIDKDIVRDWHIATIFTGKPLPEDHKAVTLRLTYNAADRTLSDEEIRKHHDRLEKSLKSIT